MNGHWRRLLPALVIAVTLALGILIGTVASRGVRAAKPGIGAPDAKPLPAPSPVELSNSFATVAAEVGPAVVNINTESTVRVSRRRFRLPNEYPFDDFFDRFFHFELPEGTPSDLQQQSLGSGVILDKAGYILTNYHVVTQNGEDKPVDRINVYLHGNDGTRWRAKIIGTDKWTDLAVIKINAAKSLPTAMFGDSDSMRVGDWVLAIGSPFGLESTVTAGIISAKERNREGEIEQGSEGQFKRFIQTDAAINPGNSGGPLVNLAGQVIGINTSIATRRGTYDGVGFAIPSNTVRKVYNSLISSGHVSRGAIGVQFHTQQTAALLRSFGTDHGVVIDLVEPGTPADRAGLKRGDVIVAVDGKPISGGDDLVSIVSESEIGKKLRVEYLRDGKRLTTQVEVGDRTKIIASNPGGAGEENPGEPREEHSSVLGITVRTLTRDQADELAGQLHLESRQGVLVSEVKPGSFASDLGVFRGDIILSLNRKPVTSSEDFNALQSQLKSGMDVVLLIARHNAPRGFTTLFLADRLP